MEDEVNRYIQDLERRNSQLEQGQQDVSRTASSMFSSEENTNLIQWQLDLNEELERIWHLLQGHEIKFDDEGNKVYVEPADKSLKPFNEYGVKLLMQIVAMYLNRNTILSSYEVEDINQRVHSIGVEITDLIHNKYEEMGMDTPEKIKLYPIICLELVDAIESAYRRALDAGERESLRTARMVTQNDSFANRQFNNPQVNKRNILRPSTWFKT